MFDILPQFSGTLWILAAFLIAISIIVAVHEYGHYIVGRWCGIHADVFSIGFGPVLFATIDKRGTRWQIAALPIGGYVKFAGDANPASGKDAVAMAAVSNDPRAMRRTMHGAPLWARAMTVAAGPVFNFVLSILIFFAVAYTTGVARDPLTVGEMRALPQSFGDDGLREGDQIVAINDAAVPSLSAPGNTFFSDLPDASSLIYDVVRDGRRLSVSGPFILPPLVDQVVPRSAAIAAGIRAGDVITAIDGVPIFGFDAVRQAVGGSGGAALSLTIWRAGDTIEVSLTPEAVDEPQPDGTFKRSLRIGIVGGMAFTPQTEAPGVATALIGGLENTWRIITGSLSGLKNIIVGNISTCNLSGPVGIAQASGAMASQGAQSFIYFIAVLSTAIGFINLFPIPALDGGHLVFYAYEAVAGRPPNDGAMRVLMMVGLTLILSLMVFSLANDLFC
ncbi:MAG: RIP metalloprotease RseP [Pseudomonadota bacterium]